MIACVTLPPSTLRQTPSACREFLRRSRRRIQLALNLDDITIWRPYHFVWHERDFFLTSFYPAPMNRLIEKIVFGLVIAWRFATCPTRTFVLREGDDRRRHTTAFLIGYHDGLVASMTATTEFVVPRSIPMTLLMKGSPLVTIGQWPDNQNGAGSVANDARSHAAEPHLLQMAVPVRAHCDESDAVGRCTGESRQQVSPTRRPALR